MEVARTAQPQQCGIWAASALYARTCGSVRFLTHWPRTKIKPASSGMLYQVLNPLSPVDFYITIYMCTELFLVAGLLISNAFSVFCICPLLTIASFDIIDIIFGNGWFSNFMLRLPLWVRLPLPVSHSSFTYFCG